MHHPALRLHIWAGTTDVGPSRRVFPARDDAGPRRHADAGHVAVGFAAGIGVNLQIGGVGQ